MTISQEHTAVRLTVDQLTVPVESDVFLDNPEATYYIGMIAVPGEVTMPKEYDAWLQFRGNVYIDEMKFLPEDARDEQGRETDEDDDRSVHIAVLQNSQNDELPRIIGGARLIIKHDENDSLPIEKMYPEAFGDEAAPSDSTEASRLISRHPNRVVQGAIGMALIRTMAVWTYDNGRKPVYAVIEEGKLGRIFDRVRLPYAAVSEPKLVDEYATVNTAIAIDPAEVLASIRPDYHVDAPMMRAFYNGAETHKGLGFFDESLVKEK